MIGVLVVSGETVHHFAYGREATVPLLELDDACATRLDAAVGAAVPWIADVRRVDDPLPRRVRATGSPPGTYAPPAVRDRSFELSAALFRAAAWMGADLPRGVWASATVSKDGTLGPVGQLSTKAAAVPDGHTLVVWSGQAEEARRPGIRLVEVATLADAVKRLWPAPSFPTLGRDAADAAWTFALRRRGGGPWRAIAQGVLRLAEQHPSEALTIAAHVARRHSGEPVGVAASPDLLREVPLAVRLECGAHVLQGLADSAAPDWEPTARAWGETLHRGHDLFPPHLMLMGALGRLYASWRRYDEAVAWLDRAIDGWFAQHDPKEASHALCERLRVESVRAGEGRVPEPLVERAVESLKHQPQPRWIAGALYRAAWWAGDADLRSALTEAWPDLVTGTRWDPDRARIDAPEERALAALLRNPADAAALDTLGADPRWGTDVRRFRALLTPGEQLGEVIAREWRY